jgi:hypothetical protein
MGQDFGICAAVRTNSFDTGRRAFVWMMEEKVAVSDDVKISVSHRPVAGE